MLIDNYLPNFLVKVTIFLNFHLYNQWKDLVQKVGNLKVLKNREFQNCELQNQELQELPVACTIKVDTVG